MGIFFPKQRLPLAEKLKDNCQWGKDMVDTIERFHTSGDRNLTADFERKLSNYQLYNNFLNQKDFERECNPLGIEVGQFKDEIKPYNKTYNKIQVLLGEELKRNFNFRAVLTSAKGAKERERKKTELLRDYIQAAIQNEMKLYELKLRKAQGSTSPISQEQAAQLEQQIKKEMDEYMDPKEIEKFMATTYRQSREILAQQILEYVVKKQSLHEKRNDAFKHGAIAGEEIVWVGVRNGEPVVEVLNPLHVFYHKSPDVKYLHKGLYAGYKSYMTSGDILDKWGNRLAEEDLEKIQRRYPFGSGMQDNIIGKDMNYINYDIEYEFNRRGIGAVGQNGNADSTDWLVTHVEWRSQKQIGFLTTYTEDGEEKVDIVSEDFPMPDVAKKVSAKNALGVSTEYYMLPDGSKLEWAWIPEIWEGTKIGPNIYVDVRRKEYQYRSLDNPWDVALGYHGVCYNNTNASNISLMDRMKPYQYLYFIVAHKMKQLIARDRGKTMPFDVTMVDPNIGLEKTLYYLNEMDLDIYNPLANAGEPGSAQRGKATNSIDRSNMQHIMNYIQVLEAIDSEIGEAAGITKQREGQMGAYEAVNNNQQAIAQSAHITEIFFNVHFKLWEHILNSIIQCTQVAWQGRSVVKQYVLDDLSVKTLEIMGDELNNEDVGVFISNTTKDEELFSQLRQLAQPLLQNDKAKFSDIIKLLKAVSVEDLTREIEASERASEESMQAQSSAQQEAQKQAMLIQSELEDKKFEHEKELKQMEIDADIYMKQMDVFKFQKDLDSDNNGIPDPLEVEKFLHQQKMDHAALDLEKKKLDQKDKEIQIKNKVANKPKTK